MTTTPAILEMTQAEAEAAMTELSDLFREVETALGRAPEKSKSGRYAVYIPGAVVVGTYASKKAAIGVASEWADRLDWKRSSQSAGCRS